MSVALRARSMDATLPAAGRRWEENDALGVARDLVEGSHELRLTASPRVRRRHGGPQSLLELGPERLDQLALLLGDLRIAFGEQDLAVTGLHAEELHAGHDYDKARGSGRRNIISAYTSSSPAP